MWKRRLEALPRFIGRAVVDRHDFKSTRSLLQHWIEGVEKTGDGSRLVIERHDHRDQRL
jgi:hypothetical protein